jgi:hypothetical protein
MDKPLGCPQRIVICLDAGDHFNDAGSRVILENSASLYIWQINLGQNSMRDKGNMPSLIPPLRIVLPVLPVRWRRRIHLGLR